jgi:mono/diheme cytochrome c family protein
MIRGCLRLQSEKREGDMRPRFTRIMMTIIAALCLGVMAGILLAQQPEATDARAPFDCSPEGLYTTLNMIGRLYYPEPTAPLDTFTNNVYQTGLLYQELALKCGYTEVSDANSNNLMTLQELIDQARLLEEQRIGTDPVEALAQMEDLTGDPVRGEALYNSYEKTVLKRRLNCVGCHAQSIGGPATENLWNSDALEEPEFEDYTIEQYFVESIINPWVYIVLGWADIMPPQYGEIMAAQDLADIVAYLRVVSADYTGPDSMDAIGEGTEPKN